MAAPRVIGAALNGQPLGDAAFDAMVLLIYSPITGFGGYVAATLWERRQQAKATTSPAPIDMPAPTSHATKQGEDESPDPFTIAGAEILSGDLEPAAWARSLVDAKGDELKAKGRYVELRVAQLAGGALDPLGQGSGQALAE
jgi:hypothetical protein